MCFSPEADFAAAVVVGTIGVATLRRVRTRREVMIGALPVMFALHQFVEGFVWLGLEGRVPAGVGDAARDAYVLFAYGLLPMFVPIGFLLLEPSPKHRAWLRAFVVLGLAVGATLLWDIAHHPLRAFAGPRAIVYDTYLPYGYTLAAFYVVATCGPALISSRRYLRWFGAVNLAAASLAGAIHQVEFASVWCLYAAFASVLILEHFRRERATDHQRAPSVRTPAAGTAV